MKKVLYILTISLYIVSCSGGGDDNPPPPPPPEEENEAPSIPTLVYPTNNLLCIENILEFEWDASTDSDGDAITYQVQIATDNEFNQIIHNINQSTTIKTFTLDKGLAYYWRVKAIDDQDESSDYSSVFNFYTEGEGAQNHLPFSPVLIAPELSSTISESNVTLSWSASDVDEDALVYDVYFDTVNPPTQLVSENLTETELNIEISSSGSYYWKVVVKDESGGETIGQVWKFTTE